MSDSDKEKPKLGARKLGIKRTVETGKVKQSFSHGRSNTVVVEVKRRRVPRPSDEQQGGDSSPAPTPAPAAREEKTPASAQQKPVQDQLSKREMQDKLLREAEEARMNALEEGRRREEREKAEASEAERRRAEKKREAEAKAADQPEPAEAGDSSPEAEPVEAEVPAETTDESAGQDEPVALSLDSDMPAPRTFTPKQRPEIPKPAEREARPEPPTSRASPSPSKRDKPDRRGDRQERKDRDSRRQAGKLSVNRAMGDNDGARARSLAALKRARDKEKRAHSGGPREPQAKQVRDVRVPDAITVQELANRMAEKGADLVKALFKMGMAVTVNQTVDQDTAELLVSEFGHNIKRVSEADVELELETAEDAPEDMKPRAAVVTVMGHVDHGKTSLLDALRGAGVAGGEAGGITQHIGAYQVQVKDKSTITFLDTPGHEAFTEMRARGADVTDIAVLVVAADDGLMPQTIEAINHIKAAEVPMIVAINKIDREDANAQRVRERLLEHEVIVEELSGDVQDVEVSALKKTGLDELIEKIQLQAELMELKANPDRAAEGTVVEAKLDKGRGAVATILVNRGTLKVGDIFVVGAESGKVRALINDQGKQVKQAGPSVPVEVLGLSGVPMSGDALQVVDSDVRAREVAEYRQNVQQEKRTAQAPANLESMFSAMKDKQAIEYPLVVKGDTQGTVEAIIGSLEKISTDDIRARILHSGVGGITESDVTLASASGAPIIGFNVRANAKARGIAEKNGVALKYYDVIYDLTDEIRAGMAGELGPEAIETVVGRAEIKEVFSAGKHGKAAGLLVTEGVIRKALKARITRDDVIIYNGEIASLRRFKDDVAEVRAGLECGVTFTQNFTDIKAGDYLETFEVEMRERTL